MSVNFFWCSVLLFGQAIIIMAFLVSDPSGVVVAYSHDHAPAVDEDWLQAPGKSVIYNLIDIIDILFSCSNSV